MPPATRSQGRGIPNKETPKQTKVKINCILCHLSQDNSEITAKGIGYFKFPTKVRLKNLWTKKILKKFRKAKILDDSKICSRHFCVSDFVLRNRKIQLKPGAVPTLDDQLKPEKIQRRNRKISKEIEPIEDLSILSLNAAFENQETYTFCLTKPAVMVLRLSSMATITKAQADSLILHRLDRAEQETEAATKIIPLTGNACRLCLENHELSSIFDDLSVSGSTVRVAKLIMTFSDDIFIFNTDGLPKKICQSCLSELAEAYHLRLKIQQTDKALKKMFTINENQDELVIGEIEGLLGMCRVCMHNEFLKIIKNETAIELLADDETFSLNDGLPKCICDVCEDRIEKTMIFIDRIAEVNAMLIKVFTNNFEIEKELPQLSDEHTSYTKDLLFGVTKNTPSLDNDLQTEISHYYEELSQVIPPTVTLHIWPPEIATLLERRIRKRKICEIQEKEKLDGGITVKTIKELTASPAPPPPQPPTPVIVQNFSLKPARKCHICEKVFIRPSKLVEHIANVHSGANFQCEHCPKTFKTFQNAMRHKKQVHENLRFRCEECSVEYADPFNLKMHNLKFHATGEAIHDCKLCGEKFRHQLLLNHHIRLHTKKRSDRAPRKKSSGRPVVGVRAPSCKTCDMTFDTHEEFTKHHQDHNGKYECQKCQTISTTKVQAYLHYSNCRKQENFCVLCDYKTYSATNFRRHMTQHTASGVKKLECQICDDKYTSKESLEVHIRVHTGEQPYECQLCDETFSDPSSLHNHKLKHNEDEVVAEISCCTTNKPTEVKPKLEDIEDDDEWVVNFLES